MNKNDICKKQFGRDLKELLKKTRNTSDIGKWASSVYWKHLLDLEDGVRRLALDLGNMEPGSEFAFSYEELDQIANDLIAGKEVKL